MGKLRLGNGVIDADKLHLGGVAVDAVYYGAEQIWPPFTPASLFSGAEGFWLDPSDIGTMFQDEAGTLPVSSDGQTVRLALDKSGNGNHFTGETTYRTDGIRHWFEDGGLSVGNAFTFEPNWTMLAVAQLNSYGGTIFSLGLSSTSYIRFNPYVSVNRIRIFTRHQSAGIGQVVHTDSSVPYGTDSFMVGIISPGFQSLQQNDNPPSTTTNNWINESGIGASASFTNGAGSRIYQSLAINRQLTAQEHAEVRAIFLEKRDGA